MAELSLEIVTPQGAVLKAEASSVSAPGVEGAFAILHDHRPALIMLSGGTVSYDHASGGGRVIIRGGVAEVSPGGVLILADEAVFPAKADPGAARTVLEDVRKRKAGAEYLDDATLVKLDSDRAFAEAIIALK